MIEISEKDYLIAQLNKRVPGLVEGIYLSEAYRLILYRIIELEDQITKLKEKAPNENT